MNQKLFIIDLLDKPSAWKGHGEFAIRLCKLLKPKVIVDLGVDYGFSTFCFAYGGSESDSEVFGIDSFEGDSQAGVRDSFHYVETKSQFLENKYRITKPILVKGYFSEVAKTWVKKIDLLHIDGLHTYGAVKEDYETWSKFLADDGVVLFHDTISYVDTVGKFLNEIGAEGYAINFAHSNGLGVFARSKEVIEKIKAIA